MAYGPKDPQANEQAPKEPELLPLCVAVNVAYAHLAPAEQMSSLTRFREQLDFIAAALATVIPVYGRLGREDRPRLMPSHELRSGAFRDGARYFVCSGAPVWHGLMVPKSAFVDVIGNLVMQLTRTGPRPCSLRRSTARKTPLMPVTAEIDDEVASMA